MIFTTRKKGQTEIAKGTHEVSFVRPEALVFRPGQYTQVGLTNLAYPDPKGHSRQFSFASAPQNNDDVSVVFRDTGSGFKRSLLELPIGSEVVIEQGAGSFLLPLAPTKPIVLVAGGVGIAPFMSYLREIVLNSLSTSITLLYGNRSPEQVAYHKELIALTRQTKHFSLQCVYKQPTPELFTPFTKRYHDALWFVVGPPPMVATTIYGLQAGGIIREKIIVEAFEGY